MTPKVKLFFVFMAVSAVVSVFSFFDIFSGVRSAKLDDAAKSLLPVEDDADQDGLSNTDESYWNTDFQNSDSDGDGFLDGEEVASGFDPREPSSHELGDRLEDTVFGSVKTIQAGDFEETNFTDKTMNLLIGGLAAGDLKREADSGKKEAALSVLAASTIEDFYKSFPVLTPELNIVNDSPENQNKYLTSLAEIIKRDLINSPQKLDLTQNPFFQSNFFKPRAEHFRSSRDSASSLTIPINWVETHKKIIDILNRFYLNHMAIANYDEDSVKAIVAFNDIENLNNEVRDILKEIQEKIKSNQLTPSDVVFEILNDLYK